ncbi:MAG: hypothetical protein ABIJ21_00960 [Nanoarchaeota archaeon]
MTSFSPYPSILNPRDRSSTGMIRDYLKLLEIPFQESEFLNPESFYSCNLAFRNAAREPELPRLFVRYHLNPCACDAYISLTGVLSFIRQAYMSKLFGKPDRYYEQAPFYRSCEYHPHKNMPLLNLVACYGENKKKSYEGPLANAPHALAGPLDQYYFKDWHAVTSRLIGKPEELQEAKGVFVSSHSGDILLKEDLEELSQGKTITTIDYGDIYQVDYAVFYMHDGTIYGLYVHMFD